MKYDMTLRAACERYWREHARHLASGSTVAHHLACLEGYLGPTTLLSEITPAVVRSFIERRRDEVEPATINRHLSTLRRMLRTADEEWDVVVGKVQISRLLLPEPVGREVYLSDDEIDRLMAELVPHLQAVVRMALYTGLRRGNILGLDWSDVDLDHARLCLRVKHKHREGKIHSVPLIKEAVTLLRCLAPNPKDRVGPVFTYGNPVLACPCPACTHRSDLKGKRIGDFKRGFTRARERAGLPHVRFHDLRHTVASRLLNAGYPLKVVKEILGHSDIRTTERYAHLEASTLERAMDHALSTRALTPAPGVVAKQAVTHLSTAKLSTGVDGPDPTESGAGATGIEPATFGFGDRGTPAQKARLAQNLELVQRLIDEIGREVT